MEPESKWLVHLNSSLVFKWSNRLNHGIINNFDCGKQSLKPLLHPLNLTLDLQIYTIFFIPYKTITHRILKFLELIFFNYIDCLKTGLVWNSNGDKLNTLVSSFLMVFNHPISCQFFKWSTRLDHFLQK
jgi:hypothetical protein